MAGKYVFNKALKELRIQLCQKSEGSAVTRAFITRMYPLFKKDNPDTPILIREAYGTEPKIWARYEHGREKMERLSSLDDAAIEGKVSELIKSGSR